MLRPCLHSRHTGPVEHLPHHLQQPRTEMRDKLGEPARLRHRAAPYICCHAWASSARLRVAVWGWLRAGPTS